MLPEWYVFITAGVFGAIIGSFLNVVIYRFHTGRSINGHSHCMSCGNRLRWFELFPVLSYVALRGNCRYCHSAIPSRYLLVEALTAVSFGFLYITTPDPVTFLLMALVVALLVVTTVYDIYHLIIPNELPFLLGIVLLSWIVYAAYPAINLETFYLPALSAAAAFAFYAGLWAISRGRWLGFGDAKLAAPLALSLSLSEVFSMIVLSFWVGAAISLLLMGGQYLVRRGQGRLVFLPTTITMGSEIPFAPFLIIAFILVFFFDSNVLTTTSAFITELVF